MYALASHIVSISRGTTTNQWGDEIDDIAGAQVVATGVPVALAITDTRTGGPNAQAIRETRSINCAIQSDTDVRENDRLTDDVTGAVYVVEKVTAPLGPGFTADLDLVLRQVS